MAGPPFLASPLVLQVAMSAPLSPSLVSLLIPFSLVLIPLLPTVSLNFIRPLVILTGLLPGGLSSYFLQTAIKAHLRFYLPLFFKCFISSRCHRLFIHQWTGKGVFGSISDS